jgi:Ala-tRNA(Pro) deacylase
MVRQKAATRKTLLARLDALGIAYTEYLHPPVFTVKEAKERRGLMPGAHCKSLFLQAKGGALFLIICLEWRRIDMKELANLLFSRRLSFGKPSLLMEKLGVKPGSVTPFAAINDIGPKGSHVTIVLDKKMMEYRLVNYHPLINTATIGLRPQDLLRFIVTCDHTPLILDLDSVSQK